MRIVTLILMAAITASLAPAKLMTCCEHGSSESGLTPCQRAPVHSMPIQCAPAPCGGMDTASCPMVACGQAHTNAGAALFAKKNLNASLVISANISQRCLQARPRTPEMVSGEAAATFPGNLYLRNCVLRI